MTYYTIWIRANAKWKYICLCNVVDSTMTNKPLSVTCSKASAKEAKRILEFDDPSRVLVQAMRLNGGVSQLRDTQEHFQLARGAKIEFYGNAAGITLENLIPSYQAKELLRT